MTFIFCSWHLLSMSKLWLWREWSIFFIPLSSLTVFGFDALLRFGRNCAWADCTLGSGSILRVYASRAQSHCACGKHTNCTLWYTENVQDGECSHAPEDVLPPPRLQGNQAFPSDQLQESDWRTYLKKAQAKAKCWFDDGFQIFDNSKSLANDLVQPLNPNTLQYYVIVSIAVKRCH